MRLNGKLAVITAGASGIGRAGVRRFVKEGARVAAIDINRAALDSLAKEFDGGRVIAIEADLSTPEGVRRSIDTAAERLGGLDICWAHAGIPGPAGIENIDLDAYRQAIDLNVTSAVLAAGQAVPHMRCRGGGSLIFTSSVSGLVGSIFSPIYSTAKFAVVGLAKSLALSLAADGIRVNVLCPGLSDTPMKKGFTGRSGDPEEEEFNQRRMLAAVPLGRLGLPDEIAAAALFLASDEASFVTGIALPVDGGYTCR